ncbi:MAG: tRNA uridine(34) 5-carboxymethylaminomethyl modification radical SAM/GNAT enzyme Elp3 [archaeon]|jgi:elongator complex protein 3
MDELYKKKIAKFFKNCATQKMSKQQFEVKKIQFSKKYALKKMPLTSDIFFALGITNPPEFLITKPGRTQSGVTIVAIMTRPGDCPGKCIYCPNWANAPRSYTGFEPASMRAKRNNFDPRAQIKDRLKQLEATGHPINKIELIVMGGTFPATEKKYQDEFIKSVLQEITNSKETEKDLNKLKKKAMISKNRIVGITFETRPDFCDKETIERLLNFGGTRVEIGAQIINNKVLKFINRGHDVKEIIRATKELKDAGFKVLYHVMLGLPGSDYKKDLDSFKKIFNNPDFCPDMIKIYPCLVIGGTKLEKMYYSGEYKEYTFDKTVKLIADIKEITPKWVRIMRIQRDIPATKIIAGIKKSNLRQYVENELKIRGTKCNCIRCNEPKGQLANIKGYKIEKEEYLASDGKELFISANKEGYLLGFIRLRFPACPFIKQIDKKTAIIRELHVYGQTTHFDDKNIQHRGIGKKLLKEAEKQAKIEGFTKIVIISGIGVREYYKNQGYKLSEPYMIKNV